ncbi:MAG: hypothetical protein H7836_14885, partial [Magnetococcus sp. YQC-3]
MNETICQSAGTADDVQWPFRDATTIVPEGVQVGFDHLDELARFFDFTDQSEIKRFAGCVKNEIGVQAVEYFKELLAN